MSARAKDNGVFKNFHSGKRFRKVPVLGDRICQIRVGRKTIHWDFRFQIKANLWGRGMLYTNVLFDDLISLTERNKSK